MSYLQLLTLSPEADSCFGFRPPPPPPSPPAPTFPPNIGGGNNGGRWGWILSLLWYLAQGWINHFGLYRCVCGLNTVRMGSKVVGGVNANKGEVGWQVSFEYNLYNCHSFCAHPNLHHYRSASLVLHPKHLPASFVVALFSMTDGCLVQHIAAHRKCVIWWWIWK